MNFIIEDNSLNNDDLLKNESIFHTANGYLGIRGNFEEGYDAHFKTIRGTYLNAFHETDKIQYGEKLHGFPDEKQSILNVIDAQGIELLLDDERFSLFDGKVLGFKRYLDLQKGVAVREAHWRSNKGHEFLLRFRRMASFDLLALFLTVMELESINYEGAVTIVSTLNGDVANYSDHEDPRVSAETVKALDIKQAFVKDDIATLSAATRNSGLEVACSVLCKVNSLAEIQAECLDYGIKTSYTVLLKPHTPLIFEKYAFYTDSLRQEEPVEHGRSLCMIAKAMTADVYFDKQRVYLDAFWQNSDIEIMGNDSISQGVRYSIFQLLQSVGKDAHSNICAKGLSGEGYEGHYFWDTEIYMLPFFTLTVPELAKNLLNYRYGILDSARANAAKMGHRKGALFPWRTITGSECSAFFPAGTAQYHINADIAYSFIKYYLVTEDLAFMIKCGAEVLFETARLWLDTGHFENAQFKIDAVTGPDEYSCIVNNNYYTNVMVKYHLNWAANLYDLLKQEHFEKLSGIVDKIGLLEAEVLEWRLASETMYLPYNQELDLNPQDDHFLSKNIWDFDNTPKENYPLLLNYHPLLLYRHQVCKQADTVLAHFLLEQEQAFSTIKHSFDYYEKVTTHDSSLSTCIFSIMASRIGYLDKAYDYFRESVRLDLDNTHGNTKDGIHTANMGGTYLAIVYGFAGLRINDDGLLLRPSVPTQWSGYGFRIRYRNRQIYISVDHAAIKLELEQGAPIAIKIGDIHKLANLSMGHETVVQYNNSQCSV